MRAKNILLVTLGVLCMNSGAFGLWTQFKCATQCKGISCDDAKMPDCMENCPELGLECQSAKPQPMQPGRMPTARRALPVPTPKVTAVQPQTSSEQPPVVPSREDSKKRQAMRLSKSPVQEVPGPTQTVRAPSAKKLPMPTETITSSGLAEEQIKMLKEVELKAHECHKLATKAAREAAKDTAQFDEIINDIESSSGHQKQEKTVFPNTIPSIFNKNPHYVVPTMDYTKMDHESFRDILKEQKQTTKTMVADIMSKVLTWQELSKVEKYQADVSGDLRALASFCTAPLQLIEKSVKYVKEHPSTPNTTAPSQNKNILSRVKNKIVGSK